MSEPTKYDFAEYDDAMKKAEAPPPGGGDYPPVPDGSYEVRVERADAKFAKTSGKPMISIGLKVTSGDFENRWLWKNLVMSADPARMGYVKRDLSFLFRRSIEAVSEAVDELLDVIGNEFVVDVVTKGEYQNVYFNMETPPGDTPSAPPTDDDIPF